jgi:hypothetical protein
MVKTIQKGKLTSHQMACSHCASTLEFTLADVQPYNTVIVTEGYVISCEVCTMLVNCTTSLNDKELQSLSYTFQHIQNEQSAKASVWKVHCYTPPGSPVNEHSKRFRPIDDMQIAEYGSHDHFSGPASPSYEPRYACILYFSMCLSSHHDNTTTGHPHHTRHSTTPLKKGVTVL